MTVKIDEQRIIDLIKGYFQDNEFDPIYMEEGDTLSFILKLKCVEGVKFILTDIELPEE